MGGGGTATGGSGIHDVVVIQRRQVRQLHDNGGVKHLGPRGVAKVSGEQRERGAQSLAARVDEVPRRRVGEAIGLRDGIAEPLLDECEPALQRLVEAALAHEGRHAASFRR